LRYLIPLSLALVCASVVADSAPKAVASADAAVVVRPDRVVCPLRSTLFGINVHPAVDRPLMQKPEFIDRVKSLGVTSCRFPNGCVADQYSWREPRTGWATVDEFLDFCDAIGAEPYYTLNLQGGTEGLERPAGWEGEAAAEPLDERIRYTHTAPNPCGYTDYTFDTLKDALDLIRRYTIDRALAGKRPLLHYEMGNENWGQSRTDWPPEVYARTVEVYAKAMRAALNEAANSHPELGKHNLYIVAVGYPVMGNNMKMVDTPDRDINVRWTGALNKLYSERTIDAVQEHFYPYASANGGALAWAAHNLHNIIHARKGWSNDRLGGYRDLGITYKMPMEHTEWNIKCWGSRFSENAQLVNGGFEDGLEGWSVDGTVARPAVWAAHRGDRGLRVMTGENSGPCEIAQVFERPKNARAFVAGVWVRTDRPEAVRVRFRQANGGEHKGAVLGEWNATMRDSWERVIASAKMHDDTERVELVLRVDSAATVYFDEARIYYTAEERGQIPLSATTYEQVLFCVDAFREMALGGCPRAHLHHLSGDYPCGAMTSSGEIKDLAKSFQFFSGMYGDQVVEAKCITQNYAYQSAGNSWATDFNALAPDRPDIPMLGCMASRKDDTVFLLLINRTSDREVKAKIDLGAEPAVGTARVRTLSGTDIDLPGAVLTDGETRIGRVFAQAVAPYTAQIIAVRLKQ